MDEAIFISLEEAIGVLADGDRVHTYRNPAGMLIGADWDRDGLIDAMRRHQDTLQIGGPGCRGIKHGLVMYDPKALFISADEGRIREIEESRAKQVED